MTTTFFISSKRNTVVVALVSAVVIGLGLYLGLTKVTQKFEEETYELGNVNISNNISDYLKTSKYMLEKAVLDTTNVSINQVGDYTIVCTVKDKEYDFDIHIVDTTAPSFTVSANGCYGTYNTYDIASFDIEEFDFSELEEPVLLSYEKDNVTTKIDNNGFCVDSAGNYKLNFELTDVCGNVASASVDIEVVDAPHFTLLEDRQYKIGATYDLLDFVYAEDRNGNDITGNIVVTNDDNYDAYTAGDYTITYEVTDNDNISRSQSINIEVGDYSCSSVGFELDNDTMEMLIDHNYFSYEPFADKESIEQIVEVTSPTSFGIKDGNCKNQEGRSYAASCCLYKVANDYVYFFTNKHCKIIFNHDFIYLVDYNDNEIIIPTSDINMDTSPEKAFGRDIMMFAVPVNCIPADLLLSYKEVLVDWAAYENMSIGDGVIVNTQAWGVPRSNRPNCDITKGGAVKSFDHTNAQDINSVSDSLYLTSNIGRPGQSGSPCFNENGYFVGILVGAAYSNNQNRYVTVITALPFVESFVSSLTAS